MTDFRVGLVPIADQRFDIGLAKKLAKSFRTNLIFNGLRVVGGKNLLTNETNLHLIVESVTRRILTFYWYFRPLIQISPL